MGTNMDKTKRIIGVAISALLASGILTACSSETGETSQEETVIIDDTNVGTFAAPAPVVADIQNMQNGTELTQPVAVGYPILLQVNDPSEWNFIIEQEGELAELRDPDTTYEKPYVQVVNPGTFTIKAERVSPPETVIVLTIEAIKEPSK